MARRGHPPRRLSPEEAALWKKVTRTVRPGSPEMVQTMEELLAQAQGPDPKPKSRGTDIKDRDTRPAKPRPIAGPVDRSHEKKVRRGQVEIDSRLDLHGQTQSSARHALLSHLIRAWNRGETTVLVITGKGTNPHVLDQARYEPWNPGARDLPGVLRRSLPRWLAEPDFISLVSGYAPAHARHGGAGAWYVMLRT